MTSGWLSRNGYYLEEGLLIVIIILARSPPHIFPPKRKVFLRRYMRPIEILLDLTNDSQSNCKLHERLVKASKDALGN